MALMISLFAWFAIIETCSLCLYPVLAAFIGPSASVYAFSKTAGIFALGYVIWVLGLCQLISTAPLQLVIVVVAVLSVVHLFVSRRYGSWNDIPYPEETRSIERLFFSSFAIFLVLQMFHPEIYWGEKPMDFTFLNFFTRSSDLPPEDPWAAGNTMNYYYFGPFLLGLLHKLSAMAPAYGYGVGVATIAALLCTSLFGTVYAFTESRRASMWGAAAVAGLATYDALYLLAASKFPFGFDLYWATSRTFKSPGINEYPLWTILFADLHAHYIALPVAASVLGLNVGISKRLFAGPSPKSFLPYAVLTGFLWGLLAAVNTWDFITMGAVLGITFLLFCIVPASEYGIRKRANVVVCGLMTVFFGVLVSMPFHLSVTSGAKVQWGYVYPEEFNEFFNILRIHGHWILAAILSFFLLSSARRRNDSIAELVFSALLGLAPIWLGIAHIYLHRVPSAPWGVLILTTMVCTAGALTFRLDEDPKLAASAAALYGAGILMTMMELFFLMDRMNTTFKVNNAVWPLLGTSSISLVYSVLSRHHYGHRMRKVFKAAVAAIFLPAVAGTGIVISIMCTFERVPGPRPALDGTAYLELFNPTEKKAFDWIRNNITGTPVLLEAVGPSYQEYTRFSMNTGLPTVLGWSYHVSQRGTTDADERKKNVALIYGTTDKREALKLLNLYGVQLIVVGKLERTAYPHAGLAKFEEDPANFHLLFEAGDSEHSVKIYTTSYSDLRQ